MGKFNITYAKEVIDVDIPKLSSSIRKMIGKAIEERLRTEPLKYGKPLTGKFKNHRRLRVSKYRIIYTVENDIVDITAIGIRSTVYEN